MGTILSFLNKAVISFLINFIKLTYEKERKKERKKERII